MNDIPHPRYLRLEPLTRRHNRNHIPTRHHTRQDIIQLQQIIKHNSNRIHHIPTPLLCDNLTPHTYKNISNHQEKKKQPTTQTHTQKNPQPNHQQPDTPIQKKSMTSPIPRNTTPSPTNLPNHKPSNTPLVRTFSNKIYNNKKIITNRMGDETGPHTFFSSSCPGKPFKDPASPPICLPQNHTTPFTPHGGNHHHNPNTPTQRRRHHRLFTTHTTHTNPLRPSSAHPPLEFETFQTNHIK